MRECDLNTSAPDWIIEYPATLSVFQEFGIDYTCGGKSLEYECQQRGLSPALVLSRIENVLACDEQGQRHMVSARLESIQVGMPRTYGDDEAAEPMDRRWTTGFYKEPVTGPVLLGTTNLTGDRQADTENHGGADKAVLAYATEHYVDWKQTLNQDELCYGAFGENFTVAGLTESDVCIGDTWRVGEEAVVQVSQPRQPCWKLARRWRIKLLALQVQQTGRTGWYYRVLQPGVVSAGMTMILQNRPHPEWTVQRANRIKHADKADIAAALELAAIPLLSQNWRNTLTRRTEKLEHDPSNRLIGENA